MTRVGFILSGVADSWIGGGNYYRSLLTAIQLIPNRKFSPVLIVDAGSEQAWRHLLPDIEIAVSDVLARHSPSWYINTLSRRAVGRAFLLERALRKLKIDVISHYDSLLGGVGRIRKIGWIPDFQHKYLPEMFAPRDIALWEQRIVEMCEVCDDVIVSSNTAYQDLMKFYPTCKARPHVLRFVPYLGGNANVPTLESLRKKYSFDTPYFHLPNQFWKHKNHRVVVDALRRIRDAGINALVLSTGNKSDFRNPQYYAELMRYVEQAGVLDTFRTLGIVPYGDLVGLMRHSIAVINPSLFEGWSTTVEEAKATGKNVILSDIAVHREQAPERGRYFDPHNPESLATLMIDMLHGESEQESVKVADANVSERSLASRMAFAQTYQDIVCS